MTVLPKNVIVSFSVCGCMLLHIVTYVTNYVPTSRKSQPSFRKIISTKNVKSINIIDGHVK